MHPVWRSGAVAICFGVLVFFATILTGYDPPDADIKFDWLSSQAALTSNAYADILTLGEQAGVHLVVHHPGVSEPPFPHPRTPGAILLSLPLLLFGVDQLFAVGVAISVTAGFLALDWMRRNLAVRIPVVLALALALAAPLFFTLRFAGQGMLVALAVVVAWGAYQRGNDVLAGLLIAFAATLKLFPLLLLVPWLLAKRWKPAAVAALGFVLLNAAGILLPGVGLIEGVGAMTRSADVWFPMASNGSIAAILVRSGLERSVAVPIAACLVIAVAGVAMRIAPQRMLSDATPWLLLGLLAMPVSWISYDIVLIPLILVALDSHRFVTRYTALAVLACWMGLSVAFIVGPAPGTVVDSGMPALLLRSAMLVAWMTSVLAWSGMASDPRTREAPRLFSIPSGGVDVP